MKKYWRYVVVELLEFLFITLCCIVAYSGIQVGRPVWLSMIFPGLLCMFYKLCAFFLTTARTLLLAKKEICEFKEAMEELKEDANDEK